MLIVTVNSVYGRLREVIIPADQEVVTFISSIVISSIAHGSPQEISEI
jgi:hypothetical protein